MSDSSLGALHISLLSYNVDRPAVAHTEKECRLTSRVLLEPKKTRLPSEAGSGGGSSQASRDGISHCMNGGSNDASSHACWVHLVLCYPVCRRYTRHYRGSLLPSLPLLTQLRTIFGSASHHITWKASGNPLSYSERCSTSKASKASIDPKCLSTQVDLPECERGYRCLRSMRRLA